MAKADEAHITGGGILLKLIFRPGTRFFEPVAVIKKTVLLFLFSFLCACTTTVNQKPADLASINHFDDQVDKEKALSNLGEEELIRTGNDYLTKGNLQLATLHFSVALAKNPKSAPACTGIGQVLLGKGEFSKARDAFAKGLEHDENYLPALLGMAMAYRKQGDPEAAVAHLEKARAARPDDIDVLTEMAVTYDALGQELLAEPLYTRVVELMPHKASGYNNLGFNYLLQGRYSEAIATFSRAMSLETPTVKMRNNLAAAFALNGQDEKALRLFEKTVGKASAYNNIGYIHMTQGNWDRAEKAFKHALELNPTFYARAQDNLDRLYRMRMEARK
jgi:Tfp pilus assembly protein PilF